ncbi:MAG TPA: YjgN family protein [Pseudomonadales bacterium]|nr:YjgN family protein [Pseudomonadales bacterium]
METDRIVYNIVYNNVMLAMDEQEVYANFAAMFRIAPEKAAAILSKPKTVLRSNLDAATAEMYSKKLKAIGLDVDVVKAGKPGAAVASVSAASPVEAETQIEQKQPLALEPYVPGAAIRRNEKYALSAREAAAYKGNRILPFEFHGTGLEYFRIWIVNVFLTLLTVGIYSAWAKVRTRQYFYGNTQIDGMAFSYLATPMQVLRGRLVAVLLLGFYLGAQYVSTTAALGAVAMLVLLSPALLVLAFTARLRFTAWRNVQFDFLRDIAGAYRVVLFPALLVGVAFASSVLTQDPATAGKLPPTVAGIVAVAMLVLSLGFPYWQCEINRFIVNHAAYGNQPFLFAARASDYYKLYFLKLPGLFLLLAFTVWVMTMVVGNHLGDVFRQMQNVHQQTAMPAGNKVATDAYLLTGLFFLVFMVGYAYVIAFMQASLFNLRYNQVAIGKSTLMCDVSADKLLVLYVVNTVAIVLSAGLLIPWAKIRMARYRLSCLELHASYELEDIVNSAHHDNAVGQEVSDLFDVDIAL